MTLAKPGPELTFEAATQAWDDLAQRLEQFLAAWEAGEEPAIEGFLPPEPAVFRRLVLVEIVKVDLEQRAARSKARPLEAYIAEHALLVEQATGEPPCDLIYEDYHIRRGAGLDVSLADYCRRFPRSAEVLRRLVGTENVTVTTQLRSPVKHVAGIVAGQRIDDFDLLVEVGKGAFGSVFLARQVSMQRMVALKISADRGHEAQTLGILDHPNIVRVYDRRSLSDRKLLLIYMQFAPGGTLADVVKRVRGTAVQNRNGSILVKAVGESLSKTGVVGIDDTSSWARRAASATWPETVCRLGVPMAQALDHAHRIGILHRDVKPANVLLAGDGTPKIADFNISFSSQIEGATPAAYFGGSLAYMSPEQLEACNPSHSRDPAELDGRADLYSLAVVLWELLHGERPFNDTEMKSDWTKTLEAMTLRRRTEGPTSPVPLRDPVARRLELVLRRALSPDPADRSPDGASFARELSLCLNPRAWDLVHDLKSGWRRFAVENPILALVLVNLTPYAVAGAYNFAFNYYEFVEVVLREPGGPAIYGAFNKIVLMVNGTLYPLGIAVVLWFAWPICRKLWKLARHQPVAQDELHFARRRAMLLGHVVAIVGLVLWMAAGFAFPVGMWLLEREAFEPFATRAFVQFPMAMLTCGIVSACFPGLATTWLAIRIFFPALLAASTPEAREQKQLTALARQSGIYVLLAAIVPMLAALPFVLGMTQSRALSIVFIIASIIGFVAAYLMFNRIRADLAALSIATRPVDMVGTATDSVESF
jgi:serine/threonine protein kinase